MCVESLDRKYGREEGPPDMEEVLRRMEGESMERARREVEEEQQRWREGELRKVRLEAQLETRREVELAQALVRDEAEERVREVMRHAKEKERDLADQLRDLENEKYKLRQELLHELDLLKVSIFRMIHKLKMV